MKIQIRHSVFETNSSSTHSISIEPMHEATVNDVIHDVYIDVLKRHEMNVDLEGDDENFIEVANDKRKFFRLKGFSIESGEESFVCIYGIHSKMYKTQFCFMILREYLFDKYNTNNKETFEKLEELVWFKDYVKKLFKLKEDDVVITDFVSDKSKWDYDKIYVDRDQAYKEIYDSFKNKEEMNKLLDKIMNNDYCIIYLDEPYYPYDRPQFKIL
jgi:hypothetical protein